LRIINLGGEMCPDSLVDRWALPHHQMFNTYGPTETTVSASLESPGMANVLVVDAANELDTVENIDCCW
ncbi:hypothetical protein RFW26_06785, partial [Acinetobacter baumannii]|nr:hypothetical protein [Acinetobacter baumannii]